MRGSPACCKAPKFPFELSFAKLPAAVVSSKFTRLKILKNSARNWRLTRSVNGKFLVNAISQVKAPGKRKLPLPRLPNVPTGLATNEAGFSQSLHAFVLPAQAPEPYASPTILALSCAIPVPELFTPDMIVIGRPVCAETNPLNCQSPSAWWIRPFELLRAGSFQT